MSPWRVLFSIEACSGLMPPDPSISPRFLRSASLYICSAIAFQTPALHPLSGPIQLHIIALPAEGVALEAARTWRDSKPLTPRHRAANASHAAALRRPGHADGP